MKADSLPGVRLPAGVCLRRPAFFPAWKENGERKPPKGTYFDAVPFGNPPRRRKGLRPLRSPTGMGDEGLLCAHEGWDPALFFN